MVGALYLISASKDIPLIRASAPIGKRSFSPWTFTPGISDASLYPEDQFNVRTANDHICIIPQVETVRGIENVEEIAAVPGIHGLMFGAGDYMISAGLPLKFGGEPHPTFLAAMTKFTTAAKSNNLPLFGYVPPKIQIPSLCHSLTFSLQPCPDS